MAIEKFEDIKAWQKAQDLAVEIYSYFGLLKDFGFKDQICRAVVSISNNISKGFNRSSNADFMRFLHISLASCSEVKSMLYLAERLKYLDSEKTNTLKKDLDELSRIIQGLIKSMKKQ